MKSSVSLGSGVAIIAGGGGGEGTVPSLTPNICTPVLLTQNTPEHPVRWIRMLTRVQEYVLHADINRHAQARTGTHEHTNSHLHAHRYARQMR